ncbi:U3 small nucleolar RNA-associated protein-like protein [Massarina eburnea CBS 473.64]|uniref:U3 small nucleolar RNA-associated protein-like protein n=1 Tax=Massarina eburnea CBS 473.64 TaxID=1395130 RepID=A0A6A6RZY8_9PLEO|nr:U3 small nucleolar RNA-associated protein-like protein [Massarina eburnea CBS 473.64]
MASTKTAPQAAGHRQRFLPETKKDAPVFPPEFDLDPSDTEAGALQPVNAPEDDWEGFNDDDDEEEEDSSSEEDEESSDEEEEEAEDDDDESMDIVIEKKKEKMVLPKDAEEEELEKLIFGDSAGFRKGLDSFSLGDTAAYDNDSDEDQDGVIDYENAADQALFFVDDGLPAAPAGSIANAQAEESDDEDKPAWEDSDDERLVVSLATVPQLRKLRETAEDDIVTGKEYSRRLRKQYERLYSTPDWAIQATGKVKRKRGHTAEDDESDVESGSDMDVDGDDLSTLPLAKLLKDADILSRASSAPAKRRKLQAGTVDIQRRKDVGKPGPSAVTSLSFHSTYPLLLSSGPSSTLAMYHVGPSPPNTDPLLTSFHIKRTPLTTTAFHPSPSDSRVFISARRRFFHIWNVATGTVERITRVYGQQHEQRSMEHFSLSPNGKYMALRGSSKKGGGVINILDANTLQWIAQTRIESRNGVADFAWWGDGNGLSIAAKNGEVTEWSVQKGVVGRWVDDGAIGTTVIAVGGRSGRDGWIGGDRWVAVGSSSGIVNIYDRRQWSESKPESQGRADDNGGIPKAPKPLRVLDHLTTPVSHLVFTPDGQILAMASRWKHNALRLVHLPSATVFRNWPTSNTPLNRITAVAWGRPTEDEEREGSLAVLAIGAETGRIRLWEVRA